MAEIHIVRELDAPVDKLFAILADHAGFARMPGVDQAELTREGDTEPNGKGAQRRLKIGAATIVEDILEFRTNELIEYRIVKLSPPLVHHRIGRQSFEALPDGRTRVTWYSQFDARIPLIGGLLLKPLVKQFTRGFHAMLSAAEKQARAA